MAKYENSITLARLFDGRDGSDGGSGYSMSFSSEEILKIPNGVEDREGERVPAITYAPTSLKVKVLFGGKDFDIENKLANMTVSVDYYGFDNNHKEWSITNLQNGDIKTLGQLKEVAELTKQDRDKYNGLFYYSYGAKAFIFNTSVLNYDATYCYVEDSTVGDIKYQQETTLIPAEGTNIDPDTIYYDSNGTQILTPDQNDIANYYTKNIKYVESTSGTYVQYQSQGDKSLTELVEIINNNDGFFKITMKFDNGNEKIESAFLMRMALTSELATFSVHATGINAAVANAKLNFDVEGLTVTNGGLKIKNKENQPVFEADDDGNLHITGAITATSGSFTGEIYATSGSFKGKVEADSGSFTGTIAAEAGTIGGFTIGSDSIKSSDGKLELYSTKNASRIVATNIEIGAEATIEDKLLIGNSVYLYNPTNPYKEADRDHMVLKAGDTILYDHGLLNIASVTAPSWGVDTTGLATFNKVKMDSAEIGTSVMSVDTVQAVGSSMVFKPSYVITTIHHNEDNKAVISLQGANDKELLAVGDIVLIANGQNFKYAQATKVAQVTKDGVSIYEYTLDKELELAIYNTANDTSKSNSICTNLGGAKEFVFTISSNLSKTTSLFKNNALALAEINSYELGAPVLNSRILLGSLNSLGGDYANKFGLYAENVYLNGSLTTKTDFATVAPVADDDESSSKPSELGGTYAGVNTLNGASFNAPGNFSSNDKSKIIFWAGSTGTSNTSIQAAPFQVTEAGTLYAQQGYFEGSIITNANIEASKISAASFWAKDKGAALKLYNTASNDGILFMKATSEIDGNFIPTEDDKYSFGINTSGFYLPDKNYFISCAENSSGVSIKAINIDAQQVNSNELNLRSFNPKIMFQDLDETSSSKGSIEYNQGIQLRISDDTNLEILQNGNISLNSNQTLIKNKVSFAGNGVTLEYRTTGKDETDKGYDLYVII